MAAYFRPYKTKKTCTFIQTLFFNNPDAPLCLKRKLNFLSSVRSTGLRTRACAFNLQVPYPRSGLILESAHLLTLLPLFLIALTVILSK